MRSVPDTLPVIAALIHAASYILKVAIKFIPIISDFPLPETCMSLIDNVGQYTNTLYLNPYAVVFEMHAAN